MRNSRLKAKPHEEDSVDGDGGGVRRSRIEKLPRRCRGACCICSLMFKHSDKVLAFTGNALVWTVRENAFLWPFTLKPLIIFTRQGPGTNEGKQLRTKTCFFVQGALSLKRTIDDTVGLHGGIYRSCCDDCVYREGHPVCARGTTRAELSFCDAILY